MECTCKLRRREARKSFFPSLRGAAVSLKHVVPRECLKCPGSVTELLFRWHHGKRTGFIPLYLVMCAPCHRHIHFGLIGTRLRQQHDNLFHRGFHLSDEDIQKKTGVGLTEEKLLEEGLAQPIQPSTLVLLLLFRINIWQMLQAGMERKRMEMRYRGFQGKAKIKAISL